eukprot:6086265-Pyramimonas_sp.AAC.1
MGNSVGDPFRALTSALLLSRWLSMRSCFAALRANGVRWHAIARDERAKQIERQPVQTITISIF